MRKIFDKITGDTVLHEDTILHGMIVGSTLVRAGTEFCLHGMIIGNLTIEKDATVYLHGTINGDVLNNGGTLDVYGCVNGTLTKQEGRTTVHPGAIVQGKQE